MTERAPVLWLTGLPSAGKTTIAQALAKRLSGPLEHLDGDAFRRLLAPDLGFSAEDRTENLRRAAVVAEMLSRHGVMVLASFITPMEAQRDMVRQIVGDSLRLVYVCCPLMVCVERDVKGLYAKAQRGMMSGVTGLDSPYEEAVDADLVVFTDAYSLEHCVEAIWERFEYHKFTEGSGI